MGESEKFDIMNYESYYANGRCCYEKDDCSISILELDDSYSVQSEPAFPDMVCDFKQYDANTLLLKVNGQYLKNGSAKIGVWKEYDRDGCLIKKTDYEEGWRIGWDELLVLMEKEGIDLRQVVSILRIKNDKSSGERNFVWIVGVLVTDALLVECSFDGLTGERFYLDVIEMGQ